jgi:AmmeMemoRadiSam system protein A
MTDPETRTLLLKLARESILSKLTGSILKTASDTNDLSEEIKKDGACFVTLTKKGELRGCIGSLEAQRPLYLDVIVNAQNSAFSDYRFAPLSRSEIDSVKIEISVLSERQEISYKDFNDLKKKVIPKVHGVYLSYSYNSATFLPQVWDQLYTHEQFFIHLCQKAGLSPEFIFYNKPKIEIYTVEHFSEE